MADVAVPTAASVADTEPKTEAAPAHPADGITAKVLSKRWHSMPKSPVLGFYGHGTYAGEHACFSNFYDQSDEPFTFVVPEELWNVDLDVKERTTSCTFSEKAIMLCKAAVMGDGETYDMIQRCRVPSEAKELGRQVHNFDSEEWHRVVCKVAYEAVYQKFRSSPEFRRILSETGERVIAEATRNDCIWGIGLDVGDQQVKSPSLWLGTNILGWALMEVRDTLSKEPEPELEASPVTCESGDVAASSREAPAAPAHPGDGITAKVLSKRWHSMPKRPVLGFYGHGTYAGEHACFSNFYDQSDEPFTFVVPEELWNVDLNVEERATSCTFSEKAIMLCKAAVMGDGKTYGMIQRCRVPSEAKALGRQVENFDSEEWDRVVCKVAYEAVYQKFRSSPEFRRILSETGDQVIAEATRNDRIWGIGIDVGDQRVKSPSLWLGSNILGWALMEVRDTLAKEPELKPSTCESRDVAASSREAPVPTKSKRRWVKKDR